MFTLRKISGNGVELNFFLGRSYTLVTYDRNPKEFEELRVKMGYAVGEVYGFVSDDDGHTQSLFPKQNNYIMIGGKTIDHIPYYESHNVAV